jgi:hypothetical protein
MGCLLPHARSECARDVLAAWAVVVGDSDDMAELESMLEKLDEELFMQFPNPTLNTGRCANDIRRCSPFSAVE